MKLFISKKVSRTAFNELANKPIYFLFKVLQYCAKCNYRKICIRDTRF